MRFSEVKNMSVRFEATGKKALYATCLTSRDELSLNLIEHSLAIKIRDILLVTDGAVELEIRECDSIEKELNRQRAMLGVASLSMTPDENICTFLVVYEDAIFLIVLCEIQSGKLTLVDALIKHIKDPFCTWSGWCTVDGEASISPRKDESFAIGVSGLRFDFAIKH